MSYFCKCNIIYASVLRLGGGNNDMAWYNLCSVSSFEFLTASWGINGSSRVLKKSFKQPHTTCMSTSDKLGTPLRNFSFSAFTSFSEPGILYSPTVSNPLCSISFTQWMTNAGIIGRPLTIGIHGKGILSLCSKCAVALQSKHFTTTRLNLTLKKYAELECIVLESNESKESKIGDYLYRWCTGRWKKIRWFGFNNRFCTDVSCKWLHCNSSSSNNLSCSCSSCLTKYFRFPAIHCIFKILIGIQTIFYSRLYLDVVFDQTFLLHIEILENQIDLEIFKRLFNHNSFTILSRSTSACLFSLLASSNNRLELLRLCIRRSHSIRISCIVSNKAITCLKCSSYFIANDNRSIVFEEKSTVSENIIFFTLITQCLGLDKKNVVEKFKNVYYFYYDYRSQNINMKWVRVVQMTCYISAASH
ncbi:hypothetical protein AGLY_003003 [Aphis glycines]|uniref:Uncharacterized protein n=1 Tax=Aphis glycines TaxID=307491 RepID=A0A6G0U480_APHGL|nr:hypothetical protein AGLY_003003 [Aphis glycines]